MIIDHDEQRRSALADALQRRFSADYQIVAADGEAPGRSLSGIDEVAVALAPIGTPDMAVLGTVCRSHPTARRVAVVTVGDTSVAGELSRALTLNQVDYYVGHPWATAEEEVYPVVTEALRVWARDRELQYDKAVVVDAVRRGWGEEIVSRMRRNGVAARFHLADSPEGSALLAGPLAGAALPVMQLWDGRVLANPDFPTLVEALGARTRPARDRYDVAIVGAGPAGLAAAVYAASEGLDAVVVEAATVGGQASSSAKIRNYLGFPWGVRGVDLATMASRQAEQLGAEFVIARHVTGLEVDGSHRLLHLDSGDVVRARCVILAGGVSYRRLGVQSVDDLIGRGVFYGAAAGEAATMAGLRVAVLGGGNSAGQAAAHLAAAGAAVTVLIRGGSLAKGMSSYLVEQLEGTPTLEVRCGVQIVHAVGDQQLAGLVLTSVDTGERSTLDVDALFVFIGAQPHSSWLDGSVDMDDHGFVRTGHDGAAWLESSVPGVFAAGDIRAGSIKRVAAAVGEGSTAAMLVREHLDPAPV